MSGLTPSYNLANESKINIADVLRLNGDFTMSIGDKKPGITVFTADPGTEILTVSVDLNPAPYGDKVMVSNVGGALPSPLVTNTIYYVLYLSPTTINLSTSSGGGIINITDAGTGTHYIHNISVVNTYPIVNPRLGNSLQMEWDTTGNQLKIHNDYPVYKLDGTTFYYAEGTDSASDYTIAKASFTQDKYSHIYLTDTYATPRKGKIVVVPDSSYVQPSSPSGTIVYLGYVWRGPTTNDIITIEQFSNVIHFLGNEAVTSITFVDLYKSDITQPIDPLAMKKTNILKMQSFFGPGISGTIKEAALFLNGKIFAYCYMADKVVTSSETVGISWNINI